MIEKLIAEVKARFTATPGLREIVEITYGYSSRGGGVFYNETLFKQFTDCQSMDSYESIHQHVSEKIAELQLFFRAMQTGLSEHTSGGDEHIQVVGTIVERYCTYVLDMLEIALLGLPFEIEKAGYTIPLKEAEILERIKAIRTTERKWFGRLVKNEKYESSRVIFYLQEYLNKNGSNRLSPQQIKTFNKYIAELKEKSAYQEEFSHDYEEHQEYIMTGQEYFAQPLPRSIYKQLFTHLFALYGIDKAVRIDSRGNFYDGLDALYIPDGDAYASLPLQRILELMQHEIETHYLVQHNGAIMLPILDGANSLFKEEGLAKFWEEVLDGATILTMDITPSAIQLLACEVFWGDQVKEFLQLYYQLRNTPNQREGYFLRRKRNHSLHYPGTQHKDITYSRGRFTVRGYLMDGGDFLSLFLAKVDFEDIKRLESIITDEQKKQLVYPLFIVEKILYTLLESSISREEYLAKKYPFIDFEQYPSLKLTEKQQDHFEAMLGLIHDNLAIADYFHTGP